MLINQFINFQGSLFIIKRRVLDDTKYTGSNLDIMMKWLNSNKVLRKDGFLYFLEEIEEAEVLGYDIKD